MKLWKILIPMSLVIGCSMVCVNKQYDDFVQLVLDSNIEGFNKAVADCSLTQAEKISLKSLSEDMIVKRCKAWERVQYFGLQVPMSIGEGIKLAISLPMMTFSPVVLAAIVANFAEGQKTRDALFNAVGGIGACVVALAAGAYLFVTLDKTLKERRKEAINAIGELYADAMKIHALLCGLV